MYKYINSLLYIWCMYIYAHTDTYNRDTYNSHEKEGNPLLITTWMDGPWGHYVVRMRKTNTVWYYMWNLKRVKLIKTESKMGLPRAGVGVKIDVV